MKPRIAQHLGLFLLLCALAAGAAKWLRPTVEIVTLGERRLVEVIPESFGDWRLDKSIIPVAPDPGVLRMINQIYSDTLARTYVNSQGQRIMLSLSYGRRQDDSMRLHQPEGCYTGQGFAVTREGTASVNTTRGATPVTRLFAVMGMRKEPITYWMVIGGKHAISPFEAKLSQLRFGLHGYIPDGLLVRVSSISPDLNLSYDLHDQFIRELTAAVPADYQAGMLGG